jgi:hypothetical protein
MEETMRKRLVTTAATLAMLSVGSLISVAQAAPTASRSAIKTDGNVVAVHYVRHHRHVVHHTSDITSFSSSSVNTSAAPLNVGVNHPPKK